MTKSLRRWQMGLGLLLLVTLCIWQLARWGVIEYVRRSFENLHEPALNANKGEDIRWPLANPRGSVLVLHGLNFDAEGMKDVAEPFRQWGYEVLIPRLVGHRTALSETFSNPAELWQQQVTAWAASLPPPLICIGYSLGGLLLVELQMAQKIHCYKMILLAPALVTKAPRAGALWLEKLWPSPWLVPSAIPIRYRHFPWTGLGPTFGLFQVQDNLHKLISEAVSSTKSLPESILFIDPRDQVIDAQGTRRLVDSHFPQFKIVEVTAVDLPESHAFHLITDESHLSAGQWSDLINKIEIYIDR